MIKTRFAPSPTGYLHFGNARTALMSYLFSKQNNGKFILRVDDTDAVRSKKEYEDSIKDNMRWLGLEYDETFNQSKKISIYQDYAKKLIEEGSLYPCYETLEELEYKKKLKLAQGKPPIYDRAMLNITPEQKQKYEQEGRKPHYRFKLKEGAIEWNDLCKGSIKYQAENISDPVLIKDNGSFLFSLCSVIDDIENNITHIVRGEDHMTNTAVHVQLFDRLGAKPPIFAHMSLISILGGGEFSKRTGSLSINDLKEQGIHPLAILNYLFMLGQQEDNKLYFNIKDILSDFDLNKYSKNMVKFDINKLIQINTLILQQLSYSDIKPYLDEIKVDVNQQTWDLYKCNINSLTELTKYQNILQGTINYTDDVLSLINKDIVSIALENITNDLSSIQEAEEWLKSIKSTIKEKSLNFNGKQIFTTLRLAISGESEGPLFKDLVINLGGEKIKGRLKLVLGQ